MNRISLNNKPLIVQDTIWTQYLAWLVAPGWSQMGAAVRMADRRLALFIVGDNI